MFFVHPLCCRLLRDDAQDSTSHGREHLTVCACNDVHQPQIANVAVSDLLPWTSQTAIPTFFGIMYLSIFPIFSLMMMMMSRYDVRLGECLGCGLTWNGSFATKLFTSRSERWHTVFLWCLQRSDDVFLQHRNTHFFRMHVSGTALWISPLGSARIPSVHDVVCVFCTFSSWVAPVYLSKYLLFKALFAVQWELLYCSRLYSAKMLASKYHTHNELGGAWAGACGVSVARIPRVLHCPRAGNQWKIMRSKT